MFCQDLCTSQQARAQNIHPIRADGDQCTQQSELSERAILPRLQRWIRGKFLPLAGGVRPSWELRTRRRQAERRRSVAEVPQSFQKTEGSCPQEESRTKRLAWQTSVVSTFLALTRVSTPFVRTSPVMSTSTRRLLYTKIHRARRQRHMPRWEAHANRIRPCRCLRT